MTDELIGLEIPCEFHLSPCISYKCLNLNKEFVSSSKNYIACLTAQCGIIVTRRCNGVEEERGN